MIVHPVCSVKHLILDEADRLLDSEFVSQVQEIIAACTHENLQKAVFSATLPTGVEKVAMQMLHDPIRVVVGLKYVTVPSLIMSLRASLQTGTRPFLLSLRFSLTLPTTHQSCPAF